MIPALRTLNLRDFAGGLNLRDSQSEIAANESPDLWNVTIDESGGIAKRLGYVQQSAAPYNASLVKNVFYWQGSTKNLFVQSGATVYKWTPAVTTVIHTFTTSARLGFADFAGKLCIIHPVDGLITYDGAATALTPGPAGSSLAVWQNKLFANTLATPLGGVTWGPARVVWSAAGDPNVWNAADFVDLREKDSAQVVCLSGASGLDVSGRPGLLVFKNRSTYRIYDSATGAYQTIDPDIGTASSLSVVNLHGKTYSLSERGIFVTDGVRRLESIASKLEPLWRPSQINYTQMDLACAGKHGDRIYFSLPRVGQTANDLMLEVDPRAGWITANSNAVSCYTSYGKDDQILTGGSPTVNGTVYNQLQPVGTDDGAAIVSRFQSAWFELNGGRLARLRRARVSGRGSFTLTTRVDYATSGGAARTVTGSAAYAGYAKPDPVSLGVGKAFSFRIDETSTTSKTTPGLLGGTTDTVGAWGLYGLDLYFVPLAPS